MKRFFLTPLFSLMLAVLLPINLAAQDTDLDLQRLPWDIFAETMGFDGKTSTYIYTGVQFSQGDISIKADEGRATRHEKEESAWQFAGNVVIDLNNGHIECDSAQLYFEGSVLNMAVVTGSPASFEMTRTEADDVTYAEAGQLKYDVTAGIIEFSENATITESGNQISSNYFVYNITERRIHADSSGENDDRVRITYTPTISESDDNAVDSDESSENQ